MGHLSALSEEKVSFPAKRQTNWWGQGQSLRTSHAGAEGLSPAFASAFWGIQSRFFFPQREGGPTCPGSRASASGGGLLGQTVGDLPRGTLPSRVICV